MPRAITRRPTAAVSPASPEQVATATVTLLVGIEGAPSGSPAATAFRSALRRKGQDLAAAGGPAARRRSPTCSPASERPTPPAPMHATPSSTKHGPACPLGAPEEPIRPPPGRAGPRPLPRRGSFCASQVGRVAVAGCLVHQWDIEDTARLSEVGELDRVRNHGCTPPSQGSDASGEAFQPA